MFVVLVLHYWGRGKTIDEAKLQVKITRGSAVKKSEKKQIWYFDPEKFETEDPKLAPIVGGLGDLSYCRKDPDSDCQPVDVTN